jgi:acylphosphatase
MSSIIRQVTIRGHVHGIGYRVWVESEATGRGLEGWVRNRRDGSVEAVFSGRTDIVTEMIARCRRGPSAARVEAIDNEPATPDALNLRRPGEAFSVLSTL